MMKGLVNTETNYFSELNRNLVNVDLVLDYNQKYYEKLYELWRGLTDSEEKLEIAQELIYLSEQTEVLKDIQLNDLEEKQ